MNGTFAEIIGTIVLAVIIIFIIMKFRESTPSRSNVQGYPEPKQATKEEVSQQELKKSSEDTPEKPREQGSVLQRIKMFETQTASEKPLASSQARRETKSESIGKQKELFESPHKLRKSSQSEIIAQELRSLSIQPTDIAAIRNQFQGDSLIETAETAHARNRALRDKSVQAARIYETYSSAISQRFGHSPDQTTATRVQVLINQAVTPLQLSAHLNNNPIMFNVLRRITSTEKDSLESTYGVMIMKEGKDTSSEVECTVYGSKDGQGALLNRICVIFKEIRATMPVATPVVPVVPLSSPELRQAETSAADSPLDQTAFAEVTLNIEFPSNYASTRLQVWQDIACEIRELLLQSKGIDIPLDLIRVIDIYEGSMHVVFAVLQPHQGILTPHEIVTALKQTLIDDQVLKKQASVSSKKYSYLSHVDVPSGISVSGSPLLTDLVAQAKKWVKDKWSIDHAPNMTLDKLIFYENPAISADCLVAKRFISGIETTLGRPVDPTTKLTYGTSKGQFVFGYHGTNNEQALSSICHDGYDPNRRSGQAYGEGEYFSAEYNEKYSIAGYSGSSGKLMVNVLLGGHWTCTSPHLVVNNPKSSSSTILPTYCLPVLVIQWGSVNPKFTCVPPCGLAANESEVDAILVNPTANQDQYYKIKVLRNGTMIMNYDVISTCGQTGTIPFGPGSTTQTISSNIPRSVATQVLKNHFQAHTQLSINPGTTPSQSVPGSWVKCSIPSPPPPPVSGAGPGNTPEPEVVVWQYHDPERGGDGWHNYKTDPQSGINSNVVMENIHSQHLSNPGMSQRVVRSGPHAYTIDFTAMVQTNQQYKTQRSIRRLQGSGCTCSWCALG